MITIIKSFRIIWVGAYITCGKEEACIRFLVGISGGKNHLKDLAVDG
jgi:hypothetical protein